MSTNIEWADETWPVVTGCYPCSAGCKNCYAARMAATRLRHHPRYEGLAVMYEGRPMWTGEVRLNHDVLEQPLHWRKPRMIFVASMGDLFHKDVPFTFISKVWGIMAACQGHTFQVLTKRPKRMLEFVNTNWKPWLHVPNVWLGVSIESQATADERREHLEQCPAAVKYVSYEPALGPVDWAGWKFVSQIISGGESGPNARPSHPDWHRATRDFCQENDIAYFFKAWGAFVPESHWRDLSMAQRNRRGAVFSFRDERFPQDQRMYKVGKKTAGNLLDGRAWQEFPVQPRI